MPLIYPQLVNNNMSIKNKFYITTPIYYVNDKPHAGHAYTTLVADVLARYHRQKGEETFYLTGTDEHGSKIAAAAEKNGLSPQEFCDKTSQAFKDAWQNLHISNDYFIRTTDPKHETAVKEIFKKLLDAKTPAGNSVLYEGEYQGLYCQGCEKFITEKDLVDGLCPDHRIAPQQLSEKNYFFRLKDYLPVLQEKIESGELQILPESKKNEALGFIKQGIDDFSVTRQNVKWGIELDFAPGQVAYVWVDALSNYITALGYPDENNDLWKFWPADVQLMAQDIVKFHALYWPALLLALNLPLPKTLFVHGFFTIDGQKMSKSLGNVIDPNDLVKTYGTDATRYLLLSQFPLGHEADLQVSAFKERYNNDLANGLGNLVARSTNLIEKNYNGQIKVEVDKSYMNDDKLDRCYSEFKFEEVLSLVKETITMLNQKIDNEKLWELVKVDSKKAEESLIYIVGKLLRLAEILAPFTPETAEKITKQLMAEKIVKGEPLFQRLV
jgi:methionyl-tRNA synthetase